MPHVRGWEGKNGFDGEGKFLSQSDTTSGLQEITGLCEYEENNSKVSQ